MPDGIVETMNWGMITFEIPLETISEIVNSATGDEFINDYEKIKNFKIIHGGKHERFHLGRHWQQRS